MPSTKLIVTNWSALTRKYGHKTRTIAAAINRLIEADARRGLRTKLVRLDRKDPILASADPASVAAQRAAKRAVEKAVDAIDPAYILILGAPDVVPMQHLANPMNTDADPDNDDEDRDVPSDLPYACPGGYSSDPLDFLGATRVVGRLPDLVGAVRPTYLMELLRIATNARTRSRAEYDVMFGLSAFSWRASTKLSMETLGVPETKLHLSPPADPRFSARALSGRVHFINCHGNDRTPRFFGQKRNNYPTAHRARNLEGRVVEGSVVAAECCYGAQMYDPARQTAGEEGGPGISAVYLREGAYGFFGSTTIAYGPAEGNGQADLICQYFVQSVRAGASLGRATLEARQKFAAQFTHLDPADLKTLLQFCLLGDPSIHAVAAPAHKLSRSRALAEAGVRADVRAGARGLRRERAARTGANLKHTLGGVEPLDDTKPPQRVARLLTAVARESGLRDWSIRAYRVVRGGQTKRDRRVFTLTGSREREIAGREIVSLIATVDGSKLVHLRRVHSR